MLDLLKSYMKAFQIILTSKNNKYANIQNLAFIGCSPRSGSTMLMRILDSHSQIASPCELAIPSYFRRDKKQKIVNNKYCQICNYYGIKPLLAKLDPQLLFDRILYKEKKASLVIKEPRQSLFFEDIGSDFPNAKYIHLIRDARSVAMSEWFRKNPKRGFSIWYNYNTAVIKLFEQLDPKQIYTVRYEDIVCNSEVTVKMLVEFLGYDFEPKMLEYGSFEHADDKMNLWGTSGKGVKASEAIQHKELGARINSTTMQLRKKYTPKVLQVYAEMDEIRSLNEQFGYSERVLEK